MGKGTGPLKTKLERRRLPLLADEARQLQIVSGWVEEDHQKLLLLCEELDVPDGPHRFYQLSLALARKYITGFQERQPQGKWTHVTLGLLVVEIERLTADRRTKAGHTAAWASEILSRRDQWADFLGGKGENRAEALRVQYQRFKRDKLATVWRKAFKWHEHMGTISEWDERLQDALQNPHG